MKTKLLGVIVAALAACDPDAGGEATCDAICDELVNGCGYVAYPTKDSCLQGCAWNRKEGVDVEVQRACIEEAACDTFAIVECAHDGGG